MDLKKGNCFSFLPPLPRNKLGGFPLKGKKRLQAF
jgi:hypothetical protein